MRHMLNRGRPGFFPAHPQSVPPCPDEQHAFDASGVCPRCGAVDEEKLRAEGVAHARRNARLQYRLAVSDVAMALMKTSLVESIPAPDRIAYCIQRAREWVETVNGLSLPDALAKEAEETAEQNHRGVMFGGLGHLGQIVGRGLEPPIG